MGIVQCYVLVPLENMMYILTPTPTFTKLGTGIKDHYNLCVTLRSLFFAGANGTKFKNTSSHCNGNSKYPKSTKNVPANI